MDLKPLILTSNLYSEEELLEIDKCLSNITENEITTSICKNLLSVKADYLALISGLCLLNYRNNKDIGKFLPENACKILETLIKLDSIKITNEEISTENIKNLLISIANDIRVIIVKLSEILALAQNLDKLSKDDQKSLHLAIKELYAPISARLGLSTFKSTLQDYNIQYYHKEEYNKINSELSALKVKRIIEVNKNIDILKEMLKRLNIDGIVYGRVKHISSIFNKLKDKDKTLNTIYDLLAVRVIVNTINECYVVLSEINSLYQPIDGRFKDYIIRPKQNGYKSIHTSVISSNGDPLEIQIRTKEMHEFAEYGVAAHFLYKEKKSKVSRLDERLTWVRKMLENSDISSTSDMLDELKTDLYANEIFVQTPLGKVISLKENSTPIDFAYSIHSDVGNKCVGAKVNSKIVPLATHLKNGDVVEIITNPNSRGPSPDWLKLVNTTIAKNRMKAFFKKEMKEENVKKGKVMVENTAKLKHIDLKNLLVDEFLKPLYDKWTLKSLDDLYATIGYGGLTSTQVVNKLYSMYAEKMRQTKQIISTPKKQNKENAVEFEGIDNILVRFAKCCNAVPGDEIVGFISQGRGITIHSKECQNLDNLDKNRLINAKWASNINKKFACKFHILCNKNETNIVNITKKIAENKVDIIGIKVKEVENKINLIEIEVAVKNTEELTALINRLSADKSILKVERTKGV